MTYQACVAALKKQRPGWHQTMTLMELVWWLAEHCDLRSLVGIYAEALFQRKAGVRGLPRRIAARLCQASYVALPPVACRLLWIELGEARLLAAQGTERLAPGELDRLVAIMEAGGRT